MADRVAVDRDLAEAVVDTGVGEDTDVDMDGDVDMDRDHGPSLHHHDRDQSDFHPDLDRRRGRDRNLQVPQMQSAKHPKLSQIFSSFPLLLNSVTKRVRASFMPI